MKYYIGIDVGGMSIKAGIVDGMGNIIAKETAPTEAERSSQEVIKTMYDLCETVIHKANLTKADIASVGIGSPGTVNSQKGIISFSANLHFKNVNVLKEFRTHWDIPVFVGNDANCAALGETLFGSGKGKKNAILITLGTGVGTGFIIDGKIYEGRNGEGAEGGHICIRMGGEKCSCGERGCWEAYASATALIRQTKKAMEKYPDSLMHQVAKEHGKVSGRTAFTAHLEGDKPAISVVTKYVKYVATGLLVLVNIFRPDIIIVGGGISHEGDYFIKKIEKYVRKHAFGRNLNRVPPIIRASLGNDAGIVGAAALGL